MPRNDRGVGGSATSTFLDVMEEGGLQVPPSATEGSTSPVRTFIGYPEYPKYGMISRYFVYTRVLLAWAERLVEARVLQEREEIFWLTVHELRETVRASQVNDGLLRRRRDEFRSFRAPTPPGSSHPMVRPSPGRSGATICRPVRCRAWGVLRDRRRSSPCRPGRVRP